MSDESPPYVPTLAGAIFMLATLGMALAAIIIDPDWPASVGGWTLAAAFSAVAIVIGIEGRMDTALHFLGACLAFALLRGAL